VAGALLALHAVWLLQLGGTDYVLKHPRSNVFHANKEGICSCLGFFALYLLAEHVGEFALVRSKAAAAKPTAASLSSLPAGLLRTQAPTSLTGPPCSNTNPPPSLYPDRSHKPDIQAGEKLYLYLSRPATVAAAVSVVVVVVGAVFAEASRSSSSSAAAAAAAQNAILPVWLSVCVASAALLLLLLCCSVFVNAAHRFLVSPSITPPASSSPPPSLYTNNSSSVSLYMWVEWKRRLSVLLAVSVLSFVSVLFLHSNLQACSRRLVNTCYVAWSMAHNTSALFC